MNDLEDRIRATLHHYGDAGAVAAPPDPDVVDLAAFRAPRRRGRAAAWVGAGSAVAAGLAVLLAGLGGGSGHGTPHVALGATPSVAGDTTPDPSPYWHVRSRLTVVRADGSQTGPGARESWAGHDGASWSAVAGADPQVSGGPFTETGLSGTPLTWDDLWTLPRTAAGLRAFYAARATPAGIVGFATDLINDPGPSALKLAAADVLASQPGVVETTGTDDLGRPARVIPGFRSTSFVDPVTGDLLERQELSAGPAVDGPSAPAAGTVTARTVNDQFGYVQDVVPQP